ncbi:MAG: DEAD/DEAH box helicase [Bacteroidales bacterium]|nr:DEAD/DEAH box helicase [Bacteroidales bacterium]
MKRFDELGLQENILRAVNELGFENPMPVQEALIPRILENNTDLVGLAQTGTGKTAAFGLPLLQMIDPTVKTTQAIILSPTRELCVQIANDIRGFAKYMPGINIVPIYGGAGFEGQVKELKAGAHIIAATPGRMLDMIMRKKSDLSGIKWLVLDEADEMLNMGFEEEVRGIIESASTDRHTYLFSATMPKEVEQIALQYMHKPQTISVGQRNKGAINVKHNYYVAHAKDRYNILKRICDYHPEMYAIVFCRTRQETQEVSSSLIRDGYNADALHGDLSQAQRDHVMNKFRQRHLSILVATDVAARGIDVDDLTHVINYNLPDEPDNYIHRSGRTGRAGKSGTCISIVNLKEKSRIRQLEKQVGKEFNQAKIPSGTQVCEKQLYHLIDRMENVVVNEEEIMAFLPVIFKKLQWLSSEELIKRFVSVEFNRFLEYYRNADDLNVDESRERERGSSHSSRENFTWLFLSIGRKDGILPPKLLGLINDYTRKRDLRIGKIDIGDTFSFIQVDTDYVKQFIEAFQGKLINDRPIRVDVSEEQDRQGRPSRGRSEGGRGYESRGGDRRNNDRRSGDSRGGDSRGGDSRGGERRFDGPRSPGKKFGGPKESSRAPKESSRGDENLKYGKKKKW